MEAHTRDGSRRRPKLETKNLDSLMDRLDAGLPNDPLGCKCCGNCVERAKQKIPKSISGGWNFHTNLSRLSDGMKSGCNECGIYFDAVSTFLREKCNCHQESCLFIDIRMYYYPNQDKLGCYLWLVLGDAYLHAPQDHQAFTERRTLHDPFRHGSLNYARKNPREYQTCLELFQVEDHQNTWKYHPASIEAADSFGKLRSHWLPLDDAGSAQALDTLKYWIAECINMHQACDTGAEKPLPKRVLNITDTHIYLQEPVGVQGKYACLSHCWGPKGPSLKLAATTGERLSAGVLIQDLPKVFSQAAQLCRRLSIRYIWIDALCIQQDSAEDWEEAAASMGTIYENAYLTVASTWSSDSNGGLFSKGSSNYRPRKTRTANLYVKGIPIGHSQDALKDSPFVPSTADKRSLKAHWPLVTRAWVYQERQLSARMIHFGEDKLLWECQSGHCSEENPRMLLDFLVDTSNKVLPKNSRFGWKWAVAQYSLLSLTYESDRLPALAAIVGRMMELRENSQYVAGMWTDSLVRDLAWHHEDQELPRPQHYAPSWSWASTKGPVRFYGYKPCVEFLGLTFTPNGPPQLGGVLDARIRLKGPVFNASIPRSNAGFSQKNSSTSKELRIGLNLRDFNYSTSDRFEAPMVPVTILIIGGRGEEKLLALVLHRPSGDWERIGLTWIEHPVHRTSNMIRKQRVQEFYESLPVEEISVI